MSGWRSGGQPRGKRLPGGGAWFVRGLAPDHEPSTLSARRASINRAGPQAARGVWAVACRRMAGWVAGLLSLVGLFLAHVSGCGGGVRWMGPPGVT